MTGTTKGQHAEQPATHPAPKVPAGSSPVLLGACSAVCVFLVACGSGQEDLLAPREVRTTLFSLLASFEPTSVERAPAEAGPRVDLLRPTRLGRGPGGARPALVLQGNALVQLPLPEGPSGRELLVGLAPHHESWQGGQVTSRIWVDDDLLHEASISCSPETPEAQRQWKEFSVPLPSESGVIAFETIWNDSAQDFPALGFGRLEVHLPSLVEAQPADNEHPNVLLIVVDTLRADRLGQGGNGRDTSPVMDGLAEEGTRLLWALTAGPWTLPGTASILTGLAPPEHGIGATPTSSLAHPLFTLAEAFQHEGWLTAGFSMNPLISEGSCFDQGFETFDSRRWAMARECESDWLDWLGEHAEERFFLYLHLVEPHFPYTPSSESCQALGIAPAQGEDHLDLRQALKRWYEAGTGSPGAIRKLSARQLDLYDAEVRDADAAIGRVLDQLKKLGINDQTLICITSDHGEEFNEHGWAQHDAQLWNESLHVPLIFAGPGVPRGKVIEGPLENRHLARTLMDLAGISGTRTGTSRNLLQANALREVLEQGAYSMHARGLWSELETRRLVRLGQSHALRRGPWELISCPNTDQEESSPIIRLFHTERDPERSWDLSSEEPIRTQRMRDEIEAWIQAGLAIQPPLRPTAAETRSMLDGLGYGGG